MCKRYLLVHNTIEGQQVAVEGDDLNDMYTKGDDLVQEGSTGVAVYERLSVAKPVTAVEWNGRRRPGAGA